MSTRLTVEQLERMKTHELADLLASIVLVLRRMPDVECRELGSSVSVIEPQIAEPESSLSTALQLPQKAKFTPAELEAKKAPEIKELAKNLHLTFTAKTTKKELISKILTRQEQEYSDQFAIQHL